MQTTTEKNITLGTASLTVPSDIPKGAYTLKLFNEQINGDCKTGYASDFSDISINIIGLEDDGSEPPTLFPALKIWNISVTA